MKKVIMTRFNYPEEVVNMIAEAAKMQIDDLISTLEPMVAGNHNSYVRDQVMLGLEMTGTMDAVLEDCFNGINRLQDWLEGGNGGPATAAGRDAAPVAVDSDYDTDDDDDY